MGLVVEDDDVLRRHQVRQDPLEHLALRLQRLDVVASATAQERTVALRQRHAFAPLEGVEVRDDDPRPVDIADHVRRHQAAPTVVVVRVVRLEHAQPVADRDSRCHDQEAAREVRAVRPSHGVDRLPGDQHRHDHRLAGAGGELEREARQVTVLRVDFLQTLQESAAAGVPPLRCDLGQPNRGLHRFHLAEKGSDVRPAPVSAPVLQQASGLWCHLPLARVGELAPTGDFSAQVLNHARQIELRRLAFVQRGRKFQLRRTALLLRRGDRRHKPNLSACFHDPMRRLAVVVELPVPRRRLVGRVEDRLFEELRVHSPSTAPAPGSSSAGRPRDA